MTWKNIESGPKVNGEVRMDPKKTVAVQDWPIPKNVHELQQFLGLGNWLRHFMKDYSSIVKPLTTLTGKVEWKWDKEEQATFEELKRCLSSPPVLAIPKNEDSFHVEADASDFVTVGVLLQKQDNKWKVIAYRSSTFLEVEFYKLGKTLGKANLLSHQVDYDKGEHDNEGVTFVKREWLVRGMVQMSRDFLIDKVREAQRQENKEERPKAVEWRGEAWKMGKQLYVPTSVKEIIMKEHHDSTLAGHPGSDWADWLALAEFAYNNCKHSATKLSPFFVNIGRHPLDFMGVGTASSNLSAEEFAKHVKEVHKLAQSNLTQANEDMKHFYDCHAGKSVSYKAGQKVFLDRQNIKTIGPTKKMDDKWFGPFEVVEKVSASAYRLKLPKTWKKVHPVFNEILLKPAIQLSFKSQKKPPPPPPVIIDGQEEYEVEEILNSHLHRGKLQFLVKWVGYEEVTWQPESDIKDNAQESIQEFYRKHPGAPRKLTIPRQSL
ncbi:hypothetical protein A7U60_g1332 [Sanghuangporus baumii]|uniref:Chromo domain-containing protein n=1 Tax=Sanghuangporus baumii TaxID=108892 RepID=A0A9Q5I482_SANBA|nr:hypothetical protein A7U60_g1332 [Sanghuangporus baumii]